LSVTVSPFDKIPPLMDEHVDSLASGLLANDSIPY